VKRKTYFFLKRIFSGGSANREDSPVARWSHARVKKHSLRQKGGDSPFPDAGFRRFSPAVPLPPRLFAETKKGEPGRLLPALFVFSACFLARATRRRV